MQQSQKLKAIGYLFISNKEKELSYSKKYKLISEDIISDKHYSIIMEKYSGFGILEGVEIYNQIGYNFLSFSNLYYRARKVNFYKSSIINDSRWGGLTNGIKLLTIFKILDSRIFLNSVLHFIDEEKENLTVHKKQEQIKELKKDIDKSKEKFDVLKFPLTYSISSYLSSYTQYYKTLKLLENQYNIEDIQIYQGKITFILSENKNKEILVKFENDNLYIDGKEVYFQRKNTIVFELTKLLFLYFQSNNVNYVEFDDLEKYYKKYAEIYPQLKKAKFNYDYMRKTIETKTKEIEKKHSLNKTFLGIDTSGIRCQYLKPENK